MLRNIDSKSYLTIKKVLSITLILGVLGMVGLFAYNHYFDSYPKNFGIVVPGALYRSGYLTADALSRVYNQYKIRTIIDLGGSEPGTAEYKSEVDAAQELGIKRFPFVLPGDGTGDPNIYIQALKLISDPNNQPVLVHCAAGAYRTSTVVILYQNIFMDQPVWTAVRQSAQFGYQPEKNPQSLAYLAEHLAAIRHALGYPPSRPAVQESITITPPFKAGP
jgi:tyrosine-protein phosphatase SIW14